MVARKRKTAVNEKSPVYKKTRLYINGSSGGTRTPDRVVNSHLLYQLSYRGT